MKISFIIPTLDEGAVITKTLERLQEYQGEKEIIVSDGGSIDRTVELAQGLADKVVTHTNTDRQTIAGGRNAGAAVATGDLFVFLDADVHLPDINNFFTKIFADLTNPQIVALTTFYRVEPKLETMADRFFFGLIGWLFFFYNNVLRIGGSSGELQIVRAEAFRKIGGYDETIVAGEDNDLFWRLNKVGRTYFESRLFIYHLNRRGHTIGWPRLLYRWSVNALSVWLFHKSADKEWTVIR